MKLKALLLLILASFALAALAQDAAPGPITLMMMESEEYGPYLTDAEGNSLYLFVNEEMMSEDPERMTEGVRSNAAPCMEGCLQAWPPLLASEVTAGEGVDAELLYLADMGGTMMVVYNGWPLYYFANDAEVGQTNGQGRGQAPTIWYLVRPDGSILETEE